MKAPFLTSFHTGETLRRLEISWHIYHSTNLVMSRLTRRQVCVRCFDSEAMLSACSLMLSCYHLNRMLMWFFGVETIIGIVW